MAIYFALAQSVQKIKIGYSDSPGRRFAALEGQSPVGLKLLGVIEGSEQQEKKIQADLIEYRDQGEWFDYTAQVKEYIKNLYKKQGRDINRVKYLATSSRRQVPVWTAEEVSAKLRVSLGKVRHWVAEGKLRPVYENGIEYFPLASVRGLKGKE